MSTTKVSAPPTQSLLCSDPESVSYTTVEDAPTVPASSRTWSLYRPWQRHLFLFILFLVTTSNYFDYFILSVLLDPIKQEFNVSDTLLGMLSGIGFATVYALAGLPVARLADRGNRRTIIAVALAGWSVMTALCGAARSFWQLVAFRVGVGVLEPGAVPPAQSLVVDFFPPERRSTAIAVMSMGASAVGYLLGVSLGGSIAASQGWRMAFLLAGIPGVFLALAVWCTIPEPRNRLGFPNPATHTEGFQTTLITLARKRSYVFTVVGLSLCTVFSSAASMFMPSFMIRTLHATLGQVGMTWGFAVASADLFGGLLGGWLADYLSRRDARWYAWLPAISTALSIPANLLAFVANSLPHFILLNCLAETFTAIGLPSVFCAIHAVCGNRRRAMAVAVTQLSYTLIGGGIGPFAAGALSDAFRSGYGLDSLRTSLIAMVLVLIPACAAFCWSAQAMLKDLET